METGHPKYNISVAILWTSLALSEAEGAAVLWIGKLKGVMLVPADCITPILNFCV